MKRIILGAALALSPTAAFAGGVCHGAPQVLNCFHPTANFTQCDELGWGRATVYFSGGFSGRPYRMSYEVLIRNGESRVQVLADNAMMPPNGNCPLKNWRPLPRSVYVPPPPPPWLYDGGYGYDGY